MKAKIVLALAVLAVAGAGAWYGYLRPPPSDDGPFLLYGNVDVRQVRLAFRVGGRIGDMHLEEGDPATSGDLLAALDRDTLDIQVSLAEAEVASHEANLRKYETGSRPEEIAQAQASVAELQAALDNAVSVLERRGQLLRDGHISRQAYDDALAQKTEAEARLSAAQEALDLALAGFREEDIAVARANLLAAEARLARARTDLADTALYAPAAGTILSRIQEPGAIVAAGEPVYTLSLSDPVWVRTYVAEPDLGRVHPGMAAEVITDTAPDRPYSGHIGFISPVAEFTPKTVETPDLRTDLVYRMRVIVDNPDLGLRQGMPVTVRLPNEATQAATETPGDG